MKINFLNLFITGTLGGLRVSISPNPLIFVPLSFISGVVCSYFIPILEEDS
jgi:hypothetical protein